MERKENFYCRNLWIDEPAYEPCDRQCLDCRLASLEKELNEQADREMNEEVHEVKAKAIIIIAGACCGILAFELLHFVLTLYILNKL